MGSLPFAYSTYSLAAKTLYTLFGKAFLKALLVEFQWEATNTLLLFQASFQQVLLYIVQNNREQQNRDYFPIVLPLAFLGFKNGSQIEGRPEDKVVSWARRGLKNLLTGL